MPARPLGGQAPAALWPLASRNLGIALGMMACWPPVAVRAQARTAALRRTLARAPVFTAAPYITGKRGI